MSVLLFLYHHCLCGDPQYIVALLLSVYIQPVCNYLFLIPNFFTTGVSYVFKPANIKKIYQQHIPQISKVKILIIIKHL